MNTFKVGDIIVKDDYTYVCRIVGEVESLFEKRWFRGLFKNPENPYGCLAGCGDEGFSCSDKLILFSDRSKYLVNTRSSNAKNTCGTKEQLYPVIGIYKQCSPLYIAIESLRSIYPEAYENYIKTLYDKLHEKELKDAVKEVVKEKSKKSKKK